MDALIRILSACGTGHPFSYSFRVWKQETIFCILSAWDTGQPIYIFCLGYTALIYIFCLGYTALFFVSLLPGDIEHPFLYSSRGYWTPFFVSVLDGIQYTLFRIPSAWDIEHPFRIPSSMGYLTPFLYPLFMRNRIISFVSFLYVIQEILFRIPSPWDTGHPFFVSLSREYNQRILWPANSAVFVYQWYLVIFICWY